MGIYTAVLGAEVREESGDFSKVGAAHPPTCVGAGVPPYSWIVMALIENITPDFF